MLGATLINDNVKRPLVSKYDYRDTIVASQKINWRIEDIIGGERRLDFLKPFMPESLARVEQLHFLIHTRSVC